MDCLGESGSETVSTSAFCYQSISSYKQSCRGNMAVMLLRYASLLKHGVESSTCCVLTASSGAMSPLLSASRNIWVYLPNSSVF